MIITFDLRNYIFGYKSNLLNKQVLYFSFKFWNVLRSIYGVFHRKEIISLEIITIIKPSKHKNRKIWMVLTFDSQLKTLGLILYKIRPLIKMNLKRKTQRTYNSSPPNKKINYTNQDKKTKLFLGQSYFLSL